MTGSRPGNIGEPKNVVERVLIFAENRPMEVRYPAGKLTDRRRRCAFVNNGRNSFDRWSLMNLSVVGISYKTAPVGLREQFALPGDLAQRLLCAIRDDHVFEEALVLDTCNRTEIYLVSPEPQEELPYLLRLYRTLKNTPDNVDTSVFYRHEGIAAVRHIFNVAASLDSQIVGEDQIMGQVKNAYHQALELGTSGFLLNKLLHRTMFTGKRVRTETKLNLGAASIPQAAVELASRVFTCLRGKSVMLVGAGKTAELAARKLISCGVSRIIVANRTVERAQLVAARLLQAATPGDKSIDASLCGAAPSARCTLSPADSTALEVQAVALDDVPLHIATVDLVISSTGSDDLVLRREHMDETLAHLHKPLLMVDIAVPRDIDPDINNIENVFVYNIDDLNHLVEENINRRRNEIPRAQAIIEHDVEQFAKWVQSLQVVPAMKLLQHYFDQMRLAEIKRYDHQFSQADARQLDLFTQSLCKKLLHNPMAFLDSLSKDASSGERMAVVDVVRRMFTPPPQEHNVSAEPHE